MTFACARRLPFCAFCGGSLARRSRYLLTLPLAGHPTLGWHATKECTARDRFQVRAICKRAVILELDESNREQVEYEFSRFTSVRQADDAHGFVVNVMCRDEAAHIARTGNVDGVTYPRVAAGGEWRRLLRRIARDAQDAVDQVRADRCGVGINSGDWE